MKNPSTNVTRRQFLHRTAAAAAAGLAAPCFIPSHVLAAEGRPGANDRIGIAGIGIGRQGSGVLRGALKFKETRFVAIADVNLPRAKEFAAKSDAVAYQDYRKLLERKDVDAIVDVASYGGYASLAERLRSLGLVEDTRPGAPLCRWNGLPSTARSSGRPARASSHSRRRPSSRFSVSACAGKRAPTSWRPGYHCRRR